MIKEPQVRGSSEWCVWAYKRIDQLERELADLRKDKQLLDFLDSRCPDSDWGWSANYGSERDNYYLSKSVMPGKKSAREAILKAMQRNSNE